MSRLLQPPLLCMRCHKKVHGVDPFCQVCREKMHAMALLKTRLNPIRTVLYAISSNNEGAHIKFGFSQNTESRLRSLQTGSPVPLIVLASCPGRRQHEKMIHDRLKAHRLSGEWFERNDLTLDFVRMMKEGSLLSFLGAQEDLDQPSTISHLQVQFA